LRSMVKAAACWRCSHGGYAGTEMRAIARVRAQLMRQPGWGSVDEKRIQDVLRSDSERENTGTLFLKIYNHRANL